MLLGREGSTNYCDYTAEAESHLIINVVHHRNTLILGPNYLISSLSPPPVIENIRGKHWILTGDWRRGLLVSVDTKYQIFPDRIFIHNLNLLV